MSTFIHYAKVSYMHNYRCSVLVIVTDYCPAQWSLTKLPAPLLALPLLMAEPLAPKRRKVAAETTTKAARSRS